MHHDWCFGTIGWGFLQLISGGAGRLETSYRLSNISRRSTYTPPCSLVCAGRIGRMTFYQFFALYALPVLLAAGFTPCFRGESFGRSIHTITPNDFGVSVGNMPLPIAGKIN
jgi:hypothetical protein